MTAALDQAGQLVAQLRRRLQLDERIEQFDRHRGELEDRNDELAERQSLPVGVLGGVGAICTVGVLMLLIGLVAQSSLTSSFGYVLTPLGAIGIAVAILSKRMLERSNQQQSEACQKQLELLLSQAEQAEADRRRLDAQLPRGGGTPAVRLQAAEKELAGLEALSPLDARRNAVRQEAAAAARRADEAKESLRGSPSLRARRLAAAGLPADVTLQQVRRLLARAEPIAHLQRRRIERQDELARRRREMDSIVERVSQLAADAGVEHSDAAGDDVVARLRTLAAAAAEQETVAARRESLRRRSRGSAPLKFNRKRRSNPWIAASASFSSRSACGTSRSCAIGRWNPPESKRFGKRANRPRAKSRRPRPRIVRKMRSANNSTATAAPHSMSAAKRPDSDKRPSAHSFAACWNNAGG